MVGRWSRRGLHPGWIAGWAVFVYGLRFLSSWAVLDWTANRNFDPHAIGLLGDMLQLSIMALPLLGLFAWVIRHRQPWRGLFAPASSPAWTVFSIMLLLLIGAPTLGQAWAIILLPVTESWPVLASVTAWIAVVAVLRALAVSACRPGL